jgi:glycosyltransferase involved in cell wall biosynthesis
MKIAFFTAIKWFNATAQYCLTLASQLENNGHTITVIGREKSPVIEKANASGLPTSAIDYISTKPGAILRSIAETRRFMRQWQPDILIPVSSSSQFVLVLLSLFSSRFPPIVRSYSDARIPKGNMVNKWIYSNRIRHVFTSCEALAKPIQSTYDLPDAQISAIPLGYDINAFKINTHPSKFRHALGIANDSRVLLHIGRFSREKGQLLLLDALKILKQKSADFRCIISGIDHHYTLQTLQDEARQRQLQDEVIVLNRVEPVQKLIEASDIGVVTSQRSEVICRAATEYMIYGLPVVGTNVNVIPEMIENNVNGFIVDKRDPLALAEALYQLLEDKKLRQKCADNNRNTALEKYDAGLFAKKVETILNMQE